jgi:PAS domain S-box-containing protein
LTLRYMGDRDSNDETIIAKYIDGIALADAIQQNLYNTADAPPEQRMANARSGHIIDRYLSHPRPQQVKRDHHADPERKGAEHNRAGSSDNRSFTLRKSGHGNSGSGVHNRNDTDLAWLDEPQTLYLKRKLHVHDSVTFVHNLARMLSSSCVLDAMKKVKLVHDLVESADRVAYPVFAIDCDGKVIAWNNAMEQLTAVTASEMIGRGDYAYAVPLYGTPRPMLVDYLVLPFPRSEKGSETCPAGERDVLSGRAEAVWIQGRPRIIRGRGTRIYDEEGTIIGAVQSIGVSDPRQDTVLPLKEKPKAVFKPADTVPPVSPPPAAATTSSFPPAVSGRNEGYDIGIPAGVIHDLESRGMFLHQHPKDLRSALGQLMEKEDDLVQNIGALSQVSRPVSHGEQRSKSSDDLFRQVIMNAREGIIAYDRDLTCILWNTFMEHLTGIPATEVLGKRAFDMFPALRDAGAGLLLEQAFSGKTVESPDISFPLPVSEKQTWVRLIFSAISGSNGTAAGIIGIVQDTTARKVMEYALQTTILQLMESEEKYRSIFNSKNDPLILINTKNRCILDLNDAASALYGYRRNEFFALSPAHLFTEFDKYQNLLDRQSPGTYMCRQRRKDGSVFPADLAAAFFTLKGLPVLLLSIRDLSSAYQTADALRLANTKLNLLIGVTRHDVINNLTVLMGYNDLLKHTVRDKKILEMLDKEEIALHAVHRQIEFTREYYNLGVKSPVWQNICETSTRAYSQFITTISFTCDTHDLEIYADPLLEKVFYNLFDNAIRHGNSVTRIKICCVREGPDLLLNFCDNGKGILPVNKERIFKRGFGNHTGLGLFLAREILAITRIEIAEKGEFEKGARFELRIPAGLYRYPDSGQSLQVSGSETMNLHA